MKTVFTLLHAFETHVQKFIFLFSPVLCLYACTVVIRHALTDSSFAFPGWLEKIKSDDVYDESKFLVYLFLITILYHIIPYSMEIRPDAVGRNMLLGVFANDKIVGFKLLAGYALGSS